MAAVERLLRESLRSFAARVDTESVVQETLLRIWLVARRCRRDGKPNSLLLLALTIARNLAIGELRRRRLEGPLPGPDGPADPPQSPAAPPDPLLRQPIRRCREKLPRQPSRALEARLGSAGRLPDRDLARQVGMSLNTFLQIVTRARRLLRDCLRLAGIQV